MCVARWCADATSLSQQSMIDVLCVKYCESKWARHSLRYAHPTKAVDLSVVSYLVNRVCTVSVELSVLRM